MFWVIGGLIVVGTIGYVLYTLRSSAGSEPYNNSLDAFIVESSACCEQQQTSGSEDKYAQSYDVEGRQVLILYGTEYGFSEEVARELYEKIERYERADDDYPLQPRLLNAKHFDAVNFDRESIVFVVISTAGDGVPPTEAREFYDCLCSGVIPLNDVYFSVLAMGDTNYPHFCKAGKQVDSRLEISGGRRLVTRHDVDMEDRGVVQRWLNLVIQALNTVEIPVAFDYLDLGALATDDGQPDRNNPFMAQLEVKYPLTSLDPGKDKETIHLEFNLKGSEMKWISGDALAIYPQNNPSEAKRLITAMHCSGSEQVNSPKSAYCPKPEDVHCTLLNVLKKYYDLKHVKPELLQELHHRSSVQEERKHLTELLSNGISKTNALLRDYLYHREVTDVLEEFPVTAKSMKAVDILSLLKPLQPRFYSISSSPIVDEETACVTAAIVRYTTLGYSRTGVCTTYMQDRLSVGDTIPVFISRNPEFRLPNDRSKPIIMVGPGTGIAPFRAFVQERIAESATGANILYFGCRHKNGDFLYKDQLGHWEIEGRLQLRAAFSRDQPDKIYVQDLLLEDAESLWKLLSEDGAYLYICGDAKRMAHDVHLAFLNIAQRSGLGQESAVEFMAQLEKNGKYQKDVWVT